MSKLPIARRRRRSPTADSPGSDDGLSSHGNTRGALLSSPLYANDRSPREQQLRGIFFLLVGSNGRNSGRAVPIMDSHLSRDPCGARLGVEVIGVFPDDGGGGRTAVAPTMAMVALK